MLEEADKVLATQNEGGGVDARVETHLFGILQSLVQKDDNVVIHIVDEAERGDGTGGDTEVAHEAFG